MQFSFELKSFDLQQKRKEMGWMAEALHRSIGNWTAGAITTCIGSKTRKKRRELDGRGDYDLHRFRNVRLTEMNVNVLSVCSSTYCLGERRSMELSIILDWT